MRLEEACTAIVDCEHKTAPIDEHGKYFAVGTPAMRGNVINYSEARRISEHVFTEWTKRLRPQFGDLLLAREAPVGPIVQIPKAENVAPGQRTVLLRPRPGRVHPTFLLYYLAAPRTQNRLQDLAAGSTVAHLNVADVRNFEVTLPDLRTQRSIAEVLGSLDDKIAANERVVALLDELIRALVVAHADGDAIRVADLASLVTDRWQPGDEPLPYLGLEHLPRRLLWGGEVGNSDVVTSQKTRFDAGDLLFGKLRPYFHKVVVADEPGVCSTDILVLRAKDRALRGWMWAAISSDSVVAEVTASSTGTKMPRANWSDLSEATVPWPGTAKAKVLSTRFETLNAQAHALLAENRALAATRDALLPALTCGERNVPSLAVVNTACTE